SPDWIGGRGVAAWVGPLDPPRNVGGPERTEAGGYAGRIDIDHATDPVALRINALEADPRDPQRAIQDGEMILPRPSKRKHDLEGHHGTIGLRIDPNQQPIANGPDPDRARSGRHRQWKTSLIAGGRPTERHGCHHLVCGRIDPRYLPSDGARDPDCLIAHSNARGAIRQRKSGDHLVGLGIDAAELAIPVPCTPNGIVRGRHARRDELEWNAGHNMLVP